MFTLSQIFGILFIHWFADFLMQDERWALGKSKNWEDLLTHTGVYSTVWLLVTYLLAIITTNAWLYLFAPITFVCHTLTDYFTSRIVRKKFDNHQYGSIIPNWGAFTIIGIDQILHYIQLFLTFYILTK